MLVRRAEAEALADMAEGLTLTARALEDDDEADRAFGALPHLGDQLAEVRRLRRASSRVVRHSIRWRSQRDSGARENVHAGHLELLAGSCVMLARMAAATPATQRRALEAGIRELADVPDDLAIAPGVPAVRQRAAARANDVAARLTEWQPTAAGSAVALRMVAGDIMAFSGMTQNEQTEGAHDAR
jgi:hypothetical protein